MAVRSLRLLGRASNVIKNFKKFSNTVPNFHEDVYCTVKVSEGLLKGKVCKSCTGQKFHSFEGIPYAKPPVGELRFRDPQEPESWSNVKDATRPGDKCLQLYFDKAKEVDGSEDCLYLNVYTPKLPKDELKKLPVLVFVHGGNFNMGYGHYYKPDYLIRHDVILVTINYRLHILGFLCLNIPEVPGNASLKDTIMALKWIQNNIKEFNGDKDNVTVFGESAGAGIVTSYLSSKMAEGLYHKVICQSGNFLTDVFMTTEDPIEKASQTLSYLGKQVHDKQKIYHELLNMDTKDLLHASRLANLSRPKYMINAFYQAVVEQKFEGVEQFFPEYPYVSVKQRRVANVPILATVSSHEGAAFIKTNGKNIIYENDCTAFVPLYLNKPKAGVTKLASMIHKYYFEDDIIDDNKINEFVNLLSDVSFFIDTVLFLDAMSKLSSNIYLCKFSYKGNLNTRIMRTLKLEGATHGDLVQYVFYDEKKHKVSDKNDEEIIDFVTEAWCNFAKISVPTSAGQKIEWKPYDADKRLCLNIDNEGFRMEQFLNMKRINFWLKVVKDRNY